MRTLSDHIVSGDQAVREELNRKYHELCGWKVFGCGLHAELLLVKI